MWMLGLGIVCAIVSAVHTALTFSPRYEAVSTFTVKASTGMLDSAPCGMLSDAISLAEYADCALYVVKQDYAKNSRILNGLERLSISRIRIMGGVFNGIASGLSGYGYGYYGHYGRYGRYGRYGSYGKQGYGEKEHEERQLTHRRDTDA